MVELLSKYKNFLDQQHYAEKFDSRSNLHSSVLEEFLYYLFKDLVRDFGENALIGKSHTFKDIFFVPPKYSEMLKRPYARIEKKDRDVMISLFRVAPVFLLPPALCLLPFLLKLRYLIICLAQLLSNVANVATKV
ncbi:MAG: Bpu10I family restriction endonuclease [Nostoc sp. DedQUE04]|nr:Bpu10I family restriction endonuclease [Nostoc sp. DedQUE04]MDZ8134177.1 Bpu10I family restriction endonuclease [Nostoc sp. DedQUE04]